MRIGTGIRRAAAPWTSPAGLDARASPASAGRALGADPVARGLGARVWRVANRTTATATGQRGDRQHALQPHARDAYSLDRRSGNGIRRVG